MWWQRAQIVRHVTNQRSNRAHTVMSTTAARYIFAILFWLPGLSKKWLETRLSQAWMRCNKSRSEAVYISVERTWWRTSTWSVAQPPISLQYLAHVEGSHTRTWADKTKLWFYSKQNLLNRIAIYQLFHTYVFLSLAPCAHMRQINLFLMCVIHFHWCATFSNGTSVYWPVPYHWGEHVGIM